MEKSNYALYIAEREGKSVIEDEKGFATYVFNPDSVHIVDIFVRREFRHGGAGTRYGAEIVREARKRGISKLIGTVNPSDPNSDYNLKIYLEYGFKKIEIIDNIIILEKEI